MELVVQNFERVWGNLLRLGARRLMALGVVGLSVIAATIAAGYQLSRPGQEILYAGLDKADVGRMGAVLNEAGIPFDVSSDGATIYVRYGRSSAARMMLAEKGLPSGSNAGYELFDKLGSLGLTSFMQEVTKVRAVEGELARTIQLIRGVRAARVHIVLADEGSFRRARQPPSASVIVRTDGSNDSHSAAAIRHLVSAAVPGMKSDQVTVINSDGTLLATQDDANDATSGKTRSLEKSVSGEIQDNIRRTLTPYLSLKNFQISVAVRLNTDKKQTNETIFNPDSRVERSVRVTKENQTAQNAAQQATVSVERNIPQDASRAAPGRSSNDETQKREELTNYEISSKTIQTVTSGYAIESLSVALLVNRASLAGQLGDKATPDAINAQIAEIESLVASAAGLRKDRGDVIKVSAVDFTEAARDLEAAPGPSIGEQIVQQSGLFVNAAAMLLVAALVIFFGVRPLTRVLLQAPEAPQTAALDGPDDFIAIQTVPLDDNGMAMMTHEESLIEDIASKPLRASQQRLEQIVRYDEERAAAVLRQWMRQDEAA
ncbi:MAG TPA: flagellar basal-body MS-ring/collar protein FliF [Beijerinckiaceae bacterium]